jgi:hypothetical protein
MGLRFRKSVTLCKGVKLNFGKTGMSVSVGGKGYHQTINTKCQVTTSVGIPGSGIYYTDTKRLGGNRQANTQRNTQNQYYTQNAIREPQPVMEYEINDSIESYLNPQEQNINSGFVKNEVIQEPEDRTYKETETVENVPKLISEDEIRKLYLKSDEPVDWTELLVSTTEDDMFMEHDKWIFLKGISHRILSGDIDAYLETIEKMRPVDDLLDYGSQFEFGTDNPKSMEVEFQINQHNDMLSDGTNLELYNEYVASCTIRVARDLFALLPVRYVIVHAQSGEKSVLEAKFDKSLLQGIDFKVEKAGDIIKKFML